MKEKISFILTKIADFFLTIKERMTIKIVVALVVVVALLIGGGVYYYRYKEAQKPPTAPSGQELLIKMSEKEKDDSLHQYDLTLTVEGDDKKETFAMVYRPRYVSDADYEFYFKTSYEKNSYEYYGSSSESYMLKKGKLNDIGRAELLDTDEELTYWVAEGNAISESFGLAPVEISKKFLEYEENTRYTEVEDEDEKDDEKIDTYMNFLAKNSTVSLLENGGYLMTSVVDTKDLVPIAEYILDKDLNVDTSELNEQLSVDLYVDSNYNVEKVVIGYENKKAETEETDATKNIENISLTVDVSTVDKVKPSMEHTLTSDEWATYFNQTEVSFDSLMQGNVSLEDVFSN